MTRHTSFNDHGMPTSFTDPMSHTTTIVYADNHLDAVSIKDAQDNTMLSATCNDYHQPLTITDADNNTTTITYTAWGAPATVTDASGIVTTYNYNILGQITSIVRDGKILGTYTYDNIGHVATSTDAHNVTLSYQYNNLGHLTKAVYPDSTYEEIIYVCCNLPGLVRDRSGKITYYDYDALKRLIRVQDAAGNTASYQYDADGNMLKLIDGKGNQTLWSYDASGRAIRKTYADQHYQQYAYTNGLLSATQNEKGDVTHYQYDNDAKLTKIDYPNMADVTFSYDGLDRLSSMTDGLGTTGYSYDALDEISSIDGPWANDTLSYAYDALGRETGVGLDGTAVSTYGYDDLGRLSGLNSLAGNFTYNYAGDSGLLSQINFPNGAKSTFTYDALERLTQVQSQTSSAANIAKFAYTLDNRDIRTSVEKTYGSDPLRHVDYGYDTVNQLTSALSTETPPAVNKQWSYDAMGNRTQHVSTPSIGSTGTATYATNRLNQITHITTVADAVTKEKAFTYDADGNTTQVANSDNSTTQYSYDDVDRLSAVVYKNVSGVNVSKSTYTYDGFSRLRIITKYTWDTGTSAWVQQSQKKFVYDGMQVIQERDGDDNIVATDIWDGNISGLESRIVYDVDTPTNPPQKYFYHYDGSGNVTAVTDETQQTVAQYEYDAYGNITSSSGAYASQNPWRFSTKYYDSGSELYYYGYRFYSPGLGRWINRDPIGEYGGLNLYMSNNNTPSNSIDLYGLFAVLDDGVVIIGGAAAGAAGQFASDVAVGKISPLETYNAQMVGGMVGAETTYLTAPVAGVASPVVGGAAAGVAQDLYTQGLNNMVTGEGIDYNELGTEAAFGAGVGAIPGLKVKGVNTGRNSYEAIAKALSTKLRKGTIKNISLKSLYKKGAAQIVGDAYRTSAGVLRDVSQRLYKRFINNGPQRC